MTIEQLVRRNAHQTAHITIETLKGELLQITNTDLEKGSFSIQYDSVSGDSVELGNITSADLSMTLRNIPNTDGIGRFDNIKFGGAKVSGYITLTDSETQETNTLSIGKFTIDNQPRTLSKIEITALDNTAKLDKNFDYSDITFPCCLKTLVLYCLNNSDCTYVASDLSSFPDTADISGKFTEDAVTYRQVVMWCCQLIGKCAYADSNGNIRFAFYDLITHPRQYLESESESEITTEDSEHLEVSIDYDYFSISSSERYAGATIAENDTVITAHQFIDSEVHYPTDATINTDYVIQTTDNALFSILSAEKKAEYATNVNALMSGFTYRAFSTNTLSFPNLRPLDCIAYHKGDTMCNTIITNHTFVLNGNSTLAAKALSSQENGYASLGNLTPSEKTVIRELKQENKDLSVRNTQLLQFNEAINSGMGMYSTTIYDSEGAPIYYSHNASSIEDSTLIYTFNSSGFAWTTDWNDGNPVWQYGVSADGNAICSLLNAIGIRAEWIQADSITTDKLSIGQSERGTNLIKDSSFESNSLCISGTYDEEWTTIITPAHNDFWYAKTMTSGATYDVANSEYLHRATEGGFDGNKAIQGINLKGKIDGEDCVTTFETISAIPVDMISHIFSYYYKITKPYDLTTANVQYVVKIQWLDGNDTQVGVNADSFIGTYENTESWHRHYFTVTPPNGSVSCKIAIGFQGSDNAVWSDGGETGEAGYRDLAFGCLDGLLFEQGTVLNTWTCSEDEVSNNGVIIDSKGLNVADGKIYVSDSLGNKVLFTDGNQILQFLGGFVSRKYDALTGDVSASMTSKPIQYIHNDMLNNFLGYEFNTVDEHGTEKVLGRMGVNFHLDSSEDGIVQHSQYDEKQPFVFYNPNGFLFNSAFPLISDAQQDIFLDEVTTPGWYYGSAPVSQGLLEYPVTGEFVLMVEKSSNKIYQTLTDVSQKRMFKRCCSIPDDYTWSIWMSYSSDNCVKDLNNNVDTCFGGSNIGTLAAGKYIQSDANHIAITPSTDPTSTYCYPVKQEGLLEVFKGAGRTIQRYTVIDGRIYTRWIGTESPIYTSVWSTWSQS